MPVLRSAYIDRLTESIENLDEFYKDLRALYEFAELRMGMPEYGLALRSVRPDQLFANASGFKLSDEGDYPFYLWNPSWIGQFYIADPGPGRNGRNGEAHAHDALSFVWVWTGGGDAYVMDSGQPECWIGVFRPEQRFHLEDALGMGDSLFKHFRVEHQTIERAPDGWIEGALEPNPIGCRLRGDWSIRRLPLADLTTFYQIETLVVRPLVTKHKGATAYAS